jgi:hypothetical protein
MSTAMMATARPGYMRLDIDAQGGLDLTVLALDGGKRPRAIFTHCLADGPPQQWLPRHIRQPDDRRGEQ